VTALPKLAAPAKRALASVGVDSLEGLTRHKELEIAALHGMGPNALRALKAALAEAGLWFRA
jgi:hypothetical protein